MKNIKLVVEYDGSNYSGWQRQENARTIQAELEKALSKATGEDIDLIGSGRTDKGVHALGQVANFHTRSSIPGENYKYLMDYLLPDDITIMDSIEVDKDFHSRFSAKAKTYKYLVHNGPLPRALYRNYYYHQPGEINIDKMKRASRDLIGSHDFQAFMVKRAKVHTSLRTVNDITINELGDIIEFKIEGVSFLHNMVRIMVGTLLAIGRGRLEETSIPGIIQSKNRSMAGITAPAQGLYLEKVIYE